jgi:ascorbate-specific PTS system EIIC-type component UlaA
MVASRLSLRHVLAGLQAGMLGALLMLAVVMLGSSLNGRSIWVFPNLMATFFRGSGVYRNEYMPTSWAGMAILMAIYGFLGAVWGVICRENSKPGLMAFGAIVGLVVYYAFFRVFWPVWSPIIALYAPDRQLELGHILWGVALSRSPRFARQIADQTADSFVPEAEVIR